MLDNLKKIFITFFIISISSYSFGAVNIEKSEVLVFQNIKVKAGSYTYYRFDLNNGDTLLADFKVKGGLDNSINVYLLDEANYVNYKNNNQFRYYRGTSGRISNTSQYSFSIPKNGKFYLIFDNRNALFLSRKIIANVYRFTKTDIQRHKHEKDYLENLYDNFLKELFIFDDFNLDLKVCGFVNASSNPDVTLCRELDYLNDSKNLSAATDLILFHEFGHSLMNIWGMPAYDNEDLADEFAVVLALLGNRVDAVRDGIEYWKNRNSKDEALNILVNNDRLICPWFNGQLFINQIGVFR